MKFFMTILTVILMAAAALFYEQIWALFSGMTVLEAMEMIVQFILHAVVATIVGYAAMTVPEFIKPWMKLHRRNQRAIRRGRQVVQVRAPVIKQNKLTVEQLLRLLAPANKVTKTAEHQQQHETDLKV